MNRIVAALVGLWCMVSFSAPANAEDPLTQAFNDWILVCEERENAVPCDIRHRVVDEKSQAQVLAFSIAYSADHGQYALQLTLPLDFLLQPGVGLKADDYEVERIDVTRCEPGGCLIEARLEQVAIDALRKADAGYVFLTSRDGQRVGLPFSLSGFVAANNALVTAATDRQ